MEHRGVLPTAKFAHRKSLGTCVTLLCLSHTLQSALESGWRLGLYRLILMQPLIGSTIKEFCVEFCSMGIGGSVLSILTQFLSNRSQHVMVDGCRSKLVNVVSAVQQSSVLGPLLFLLFTLEVFSILENKMSGYADDTTLIAAVSSPGV